MPTQTLKFTSQGLIPVYWTDEEVIVEAVALAPSTTFRQGEPIAPIAADANCVQTLAIVGTLTAGTFTISGVHPITGNTFTTDAIAYNATKEAIAAAVQAAIGAGVTVTGGGTAITATTLTFGGTGAARPIILMTVDITGLTGADSGAITLTTAGARAGTFTPRTASLAATKLLKYACVTDANGFINEGAQAGDQWGQPRRTTPAYASGWFACEDVPGISSTILTELGGKLKTGTTTAGVFRF